MLFCEGNSECETSHTSCSLPALNKEHIELIFSLSLFPSLPSLFPSLSLSPISLPSHSHSFPSHTLPPLPTSISPPVLLSFSLYPLPVITIFSSMPLIQPHTHAASLHVSFTLSLVQICLLFFTSITLANFMYLFMSKLLGMPRQWQSLAK